MEAGGWVSQKKRQNGNFAMNSFLVIVAVTYCNGYCCCCCYYCFLRLFRSHLAGRETTNTVGTSLISSNNVCFSSRSSSDCCRLQWVTSCNCSTNPIFSSSQPGVEYVPTVSPWWQASRSFAHRPYLHPFHIGLHLIASFHSGTIWILF